VKRRPAPSVSAAPLGIVMLVMLVLSGCAPAEPPLARVGDETISTADFDAAARGNVRQYVAMGDAGKSLLVDELVTRRLFVMAAKRRGVYADTAFLDYSHTQREQLERELLFRQMTGGDIAVSEPEAHAAYERRKTEAHARVIFAESEAAARQAALELSQGVDFADVAQRFNSSGVLPPGGDLGFVAPGSLITPLDDWLADAPIGTVLGPAEAKGQGWFLMRIEARRSAEVPPYVKVHEQIVALLQQRKQRASLMRSADWLKQAYAVRVERGAAATFSDHLLHARDPNAPAGSLPTALPPLPPAAAATVLATWSGGAFTLGDAWVALQLPGQQPPNIQMQPMVERWIENQVFDRVIVAEARTRRLAEDPQPARMLEERLNGYLLDSYYNRDVLGAISVSEEDMHAEFERRSSAFATLDAAEVLTLTLPESLTTESFAMHVGHAATLREAAAMVGLTGALKQVSVRFPTTDPMWSTLTTRLQSMRPGEYAGPFPAPQGQLVIQLVSKQQRTPTWEQLAPASRQQLQTDVINGRRADRQRAVIDSLRRAIPVKVDTSAVRRLQWPLEAFMPGLGQGG